ncbi:MAG: ABC transporter substrate-binding protein [Lachnospiraceae bacterium]|nr:ABC transporter substrate-binding protein [Lachnospiraceae bacterium]
MKSQNTRTMAARCAQRLLLLVLAVATLLLTGCGNGSLSGGSENEPDTSYNEEASSEDAVTLTIYSYANKLSSLDKFSNQGYGQDDAGYLWGDPLVANDHEGNYTAALATDWSMSEDGLSYTFHLREDVVFHNGEKLTSYDVKVTFERLLDETLEYTNLWGSLDRVETPDDYTVVIYLNSVMPTFYDEVGFVMIICGSAYEADPEGFFQKPVGTGAYMVDRIEEEGAVVYFTRNENWWGTNTGNVDEIIYMCGEDDTERVNALESGEADIVTMLTTDYHEVLDEEDYILVDVVSDGQVNIGYNSAEGEIFNDYNLRAALSMCIDRQMLCDSILGGGVAATWPVAEGNLGYVDGYEYEYDMETARALVEASDYNGEEISMIYTASNLQRADEIAQAIQSRATEIGLNIILEPLDVDEFQERRFAGEYDLTLGSFTPTCSDPQTEVASIIANDMFQTGYTNETIRTLANEIQTILDREERETKLQELFLLEMETLEPFAYLYSPVNVFAMRKNISGVTIYSDYSADYRFVVKAE